MILALSCGSNITSIMTYAIANMLSSSLALPEQRSRTGVLTMVHSWSHWTGHFWTYLEYENDHVFDKGRVVLLEKRHILSPSKLKFVT